MSAAEIGVDAMMEDEFSEALVLVGMIMWQTFGAVMLRCCSFYMSVQGTAYFLLSMVLV